MRTFSALTQAAVCGYPEQLDFEYAPNPRRMEAAATGEEFHSACQAWIAAHQKGEPLFDSGYSPVVRRWLNRLRGAWTPPAGIEVEVPLGLEEVAGEPRFVNVREVEPHVYVPILPGHTLLTAGRADWVWSPPTDPVTYVVDVKTNRDRIGDPGRVPQLLAAGFGAALRSGAQGFRVGVYYARAAAFEWSTDITVWDLDLWKVVADAARRGTEPNPGAACMGCWWSPHKKGRCTHSAVDTDA